MMVQWRGGVQLREGDPFSLYVRISLLVGLAYVERIPSVVYQGKRG
jgi:hypothetical protein